MEKVVWRVIYYTVAGSRSKDFENEADAYIFFCRHVKKHPEYQNRSWSQTEIIELKK
ncbi:MAG: hypothetical protein VB085_08890 [Peptococcaceae bacterium]|nr:hypothetical protein [Peptococcaceae bacterium]